MIAPEEIEQARKLLADNGYTVVKSASYRRAQERQRIAEARMVDAFDREESCRVWALQGYAELDRLRDRLTLIYGIALRHGATLDEMRGELGIEWMSDLRTVASVASSVLTYREGDDPTHPIVADLRANQRAAIERVHALANGQAQ